MDGAKFKHIWNASTLEPVLFTFYFGYNGYVLPNNNKIPRENSGQPAIKARTGWFICVGHVPSIRNQGLSAGFAGPYNLLCPYDSNGNSLLGCTAAFHTWCPGMAMEGIPEIASRAEHLSFIG